MNCSFYNFEINEELREIIQLTKYYIQICRCRVYSLVSHRFYSIVFWNLRVMFHINFGNIIRENSNISCSLPFLLHHAVRIDFELQNPGIQGGIPNHCIVMKLGSRLQTLYSGWRKKNPQTNAYSNVELYKDPTGMWYDQGLWSGRTGS